ncbi:MAG: type II toxin-antitoxin system VapC family toxin [Pseudonocardia sp.]
MIALDSSVVVACFGAWHEHHEPARALLEVRPRLPAHAGLEAYSVLTRLPEPFRAEPGTVAEFLARTFPEPRLVLDPAVQAELPRRLATHGISGGAVYDALIALTAAEAGAQLCTLDRRALENYRRCDVRARLIA